MPIKTFYSSDGEAVRETIDGVRHNYLRDALGSVIAVTDTSNGNLYTARYKPYGDILTSTGTSPSRTWNGVWAYNKGAGVRHSEYSVGARFYGNQEGRWTTLDPLWTFESAYEYAYSDPLLIVDASGLSPGRTCGQTPPPCGTKAEQKKFCEWAKNSMGWDKPDGQLVGDAGGTVGCGDKEIPCYWGTEYPHQPGIRECVLAHEQGHIDNKDNKPCGYYGRSEPTDPLKLPTPECRSLIKEIACLQKNKQRDCTIKKQGKGGIRECKSNYDAEIMNDCFLLKTDPGYKCHPGTPLPAVCKKFK